ncbi:MAG: radical SAM protein [Paracoccus sp. (in: a-proteobacteria)]|uniref:radical SAM/SPASM domain-containing protein n=1 Tax=Paracoccus sp. TaxID=267 RepID=UPI0026DF19E1|nr:radical SAM protein [Paracoccus sp. (in: a-proteobacteria)]MDO5632068.1 radical SAM protein [Paracoccus sp. (in: a-proteobacteria)]
MSYAGNLHTLHLNVTNTCNLSCSFCYINAVKAKTLDVPLDRIRTLAQECTALNCQRVIISGGELFARKDWFHICKAFDDQQIEVSLVTNGTLLDDRKLDQLGTLKLLSILISLDGDKKNHDSIRGMDGAHEKTVAAIRNCAGRGFFTQVNCTIIKRNKSDVPVLTEISLETGVPFRFSLLNPYNGRGPNLLPDALDVTEILELRDFCHKVRKRGAKVFLNVPPLLLPPEDVIPIRSPACGWTESYCGITHDGHVTICGVAGADKTLHQGNIMERSFVDIWRNSPLFNSLRALGTGDLKGICGRCKLRDICGGACRLSAYKGSGDFTQSYKMCQTFYDYGLIPENALDQIAA